MNGADEERSILEWDESEVQDWFTSLGYPQYESQLRGPFCFLLSMVQVSLTSNAENNISGDVLSMLDSEGLKAVGVSTVGQRLSILKAVYLAKLAYNVPIEPGDYVPPCRLDILFLLTENHDTPLCSRNRRTGRKDDVGEAARNCQGPGWGTCSFSYEPPIF